MLGRTHFCHPINRSLKFAFLIILLSNCKNANSSNNSNRNIDRSQSSYPNAIESLGLQHLYDKTKWAIYCIYSDDTLVYTNNKGEKVTFGMLNLRYRGYSIHADSTTIFFVFDYNDPGVTKYADTLPLLSTKYIVDGVLYLHNSDSIIAYSGYNINGYYWFHDTTKRSTNRYINPLQPEVINYIRQNRNKINPWFRDQAIKRGVLRDK